MLLPVPVTMPITVKCFKLVCTCAISSSSPPIFVLKSFQLGFRPHPSSETALVRIWWLQWQFSAQLSILIFIYQSATADSYHCLLCETCHFAFSTPLPHWLQPQVFFAGFFSFPRIQSLDHSLLFHYTCVITLFP